jgi:hypothetical protein
VPGDGDEVCGPRARAWAEACDASSGVGKVEAYRCPPGHVVLSVTPQGGAPVFVDASASGGMRRVKDVGLSPIGEFADFRAAPAAVKEGYARVVACAEREPAVPVSEPRGVTPVEARGAATAPWCLLGAVVVAVVALGRWGAPRGAMLRRAGGLVLLGAAMLAVALLVPGASFFHQNGHGPNWIGYALGQPCPYGPGFAELFGWLARLRPERPEALVFAGNAVLAASGPLSAWIVARRTGAPRAVAWAVSAAVAVNPLLQRMAFTESYYVPYTALVLAAGAVALSAPTLRSWSPRFVLAQAAAGLALAQAARVHPVGWVAVAVVPLAHLAARGGWRRSVRHAAVSLGVVGAMAALGAGASIVATLHGGTGDQYVPQMHGVLREDLRILRPVAAGVVLLLVLAPAPRWRQVARVLLAAVTVVAAAMGTSLLHIDVGWVHAAHAQMFLGPFVVAAVGLAMPWLRGRKGRRIAVGVVLALGVTNAVVDARWATKLPTDALELRRALAWRDHIPPGSRLVAVETSGIMSVQLPFYGGTRGSPPVVRLDTRDRPPDLASYGDQVFYARTSLCSTGEARAWCDRLEWSAYLEPVDVVELPARPSTHAVTYEGTTVRVGLYRVTRGR